MPSQERIAIAPRTRQHLPRPVIVIVVGSILGGCSSSLVREYDLIRSLVLPARDGDDSIIVMGHSGVTYSSTGDEFGVRAHQSLTRDRIEQAIVVEPTSPDEPWR